MIRKNRSLLTSACFSAASAILAGAVQAEILPGDLLVGIGSSNPTDTVSQARAGATISDPYNSLGYIQSLRLDNLDGLSHNAAGNLLGVAFDSNTATRGAISSLATDGTGFGVPLFGNNGSASAPITFASLGWTPTALGGLSVSPDNRMIAVTGYDGGELIVFDYAAGRGNGLSGSLANARKTTGAATVGTTIGTAWLDSHTVLSFSATGGLYSTAVTPGSPTITSTLVASVTPPGATSSRFTSLEYNPLVSPYVFAMQSNRATVSTNTLYAFDPRSAFSLAGTWDFSTSMDTGREIALNAAGNLYAVQFGAQVDVIANAANPAGIVANSSTNYYKPAVGGSFSGITVAQYAGAVGTSLTDRVYAGAPGVPTAWTTAPAWSGGLPGSDVNARLNNGGVLAIIAGAASASTLTLATASGDSGSVLLSGGTLNTLNTYVGKGGSGAFTQTGGAHVVSAELRVGDEAGSTGTYTLAGSAASLSARRQLIGASGTGAIYQLAGSNTADFVQVGATGRYSLAGGTLTVGAGFDVRGQLDFTGGAGAVLQSTTGLVNLSHATITNPASASLSLGANSILVVPQGFNAATGFGSLVTTGLVANAGTTLVIPAGRTFSVAGQLDDLVQVEGTLASAPSTSLDLSGGVVLKPGGTLSLLAGRLTIPNGNSSVQGGALTVHYLDLASPISSTFEQSGGTVNADDLRVGLNAGDHSTYLQTGGTLALRGFGLSVMFVGYSGEGTFNQAGGIVSAAPATSLFLALNPGSVGVYNLSSGSLSIGRTHVGLDGTATFNQSGGTHSTQIFTIGRNTSAGTYNLTGGSFTINAGGSAQIGAGNVGTLNQTGGTLTANSRIEIASGAGSTGTVAISGVGTNFTANASVYVGGTNAAAAGVGSLTFGPGASSAISPLLKAWPSGTVYLAGSVPTAPTIELFGGTLSGYGSVASTLKSTNGKLATPLPADSLVLAGTLNVVAAAAVTKTGPGALTVAAQTYGAGSTFVAQGGSTTFTQTMGSPTARPTLIAQAAVALNQGAYLTTLQLDGGTVSLPAAAPSKTLLTNSITLGATPGRLDLGGGYGIADYTGASSFASVVAATKLARNGVDAALVTRWDGPGITSSTARAGSVAAGFDLFSVGVIDNTQLADPSIGRPTYTTFGGQTVDASSVLLRYTYSGDADLNGFVDGDDYALIDNAFNLLIPNFGWLSGDFNYDGNINGDDYALIDSGFLFQGAPIPASATTAVPEPTALGVIVLASVSLLAKRKRR